MRTVRYLSLLTLVLLGLASFGMAFMISDQEITDMDVFYFMKGNEYITWTEGKESATREELYPALYRWKHNIQMSSAHFLNVSGLIMLALVVTFSLPTGKDANKKHDQLRAP